MFDRRAIARDFSEAGGRYAQHAALQAAIGERLMALAAPHVPQGGLRLDVGAGSVRRGDAVAVDLAFGMCVAAGGWAVNARAEALPFAGGSAALVASSAMLQWLADPAPFFAEAARVLKPAGVLAVSTFVEGTLAELAEALGGAKRMSDFAAPDMLAAQAVAAGFEVIEHKVETRAERYADVAALATQLRAIGAGNKRSDRPKGLLTPRRWRALAARYPKDGEGIVASWRVMYMVAMKNQ